MIYMVIEKMTAGTMFQLRLSIIEKSALLKAVDLCLAELGTELSTRTGFTDEEYRHLGYKMDRFNNNYFSVNEDELIMINQAFNEVYNGFYVQNVEATVGLEVKEVNDIFNQVKEILLIQ